MAAGHPRISFELDLFTTLQQHHQEDADYRNRKGVVDSVRMWAVGQSMALERSLSLFANPARGTEGIFPEFYFFDCHSCHRRISDDPRFDARSPIPGRPIPSGMPPYNDENMIMLAAAARRGAPARAAFERDSRAFHLAMTREPRRRGQRRRHAARDGAGARHRFSRAELSRAQTFAIIDSITSQAISPRFTDYAGSVQAVMATDTLLSALVDEGEVPESAANNIRADINSAYRAVRDPNAYSPATSGLRSAGPLRRSGG